MLDSSDRSEGRWWLSSHVRQQAAQHVDVTGGGRHVQRAITVHVHVRHVLRLKPVLQQLYERQVAALHRHVQWRPLLLVVRRGVGTTMQQEQQRVRTSAASNPTRSVCGVSASRGRAIQPWRRWAG